MLSWSASASPPRRAGRRGRLEGRQRHRGRRPVALRRRRRVRGRRSVRQQSSRVTQQRHQRVVCHRSRSLCGRSRRPLTPSGGCWFHRDWRQPCTSIRTFSSSCRSVTRRICKSAPWCLVGPGAPRRRAPRSRLEAGTFVPTFVRRRFGGLRGPGTGMEDGGGRGERRRCRPVATESLEVDHPGVYIDGRASRLTKHPARGVPKGGWCDGGCRWAAAHRGIERCPSACAVQMELSG